MIKRSGFSLRLALLCLTWLIAGAGLAGAQQDKLMLKTGKSREVRIKSEDFSGVRYTTAGTGADSLVPWGEIASIEYGSAKPYQDALAAVGAGKWTDALTQLETLAADKDLRAVLRQSVLYHSAVASLRLGKPDDASTKYAALLQEFPKSRYLLPVGASLLSIHLAKDDVAGAARALEPLFAAGKDATDENLNAALGVLRGRLLEEQGKFDEADRAFADTAKSTKADKDTLAAAGLGRARCAQKKGNANEAESAFREIAKSDAPNTLLAGAWNGLGDLALAAAMGKRDLDGLHVAVLSYMRGVVLYTPAQGEVSDEYERALAGAARAFKAIGELEPNAERKQSSLDRAKQFRAQLAGQFPSSRFLKGL